MRDIKKEVMPVLFLFFLLLVFFFKAATLQGFFITGDLFGSDILNLNYPIREFAAASGIPLWLPYNCLGVPLLAEGQTGFFNPVQLLIYALLPPPAAYNYTVLSAFLIAGLSAYWFMRIKNASRTGSAAAAAVFMFSGFFGVHLKHTNMIIAAAWIPLLFVMIEKLSATRKPVYALFLGCVIAVQIFSGQPQITFYSILALAFFSAYKSAGKGGGVPGAAMLGMVVGLLLAAVQLLPTLELNALTSRAEGLGVKEIVQESFRPKDLVTFVLPYFYGDPADGSHKYWIDGIFWEKCAYVGLIPLIFIGLSFFYRKKENRFFVFLLFFSLLLSFGKYLPFYSFIYQLPGVSYFRFPARILVLFEFSAAVLTGIGLDLISGPKKVFLRPALLFFIVFDLFVFGIGHNPVYPLEAWFKKPETVKSLEQDRSLFRIYSHGMEKEWLSLKRGWDRDLERFNRFRENLQPNSNIPYRLSDVSGYFNFGLRRQQILSWLFGKYLDDEKYRGASLKVLGLLNVKYVISVNDSHAVMVDQNPFFLPRAIIVPKYRRGKLAEDILQTLFSREFRPENEVILEKDLQWGSEKIKAEAEILKYSPREVEICASLSGRGFLVLSDTFYPGWKAFVDGREAEILQANYVVRALALDRGEHKIRFVYDPVSFKLGSLISLLALALTSGGIWYLRKK